MSRSPKHRFATNAPNTLDHFEPLLLTWCPESNKKNIKRRLATFRVEIPSGRGGTLRVGFLEVFPMPPVNKIGIWSDNHRQPSRPQTRPLRRPHFDAIETFERAFGVRGMRAWARRYHSDRAGDADPSEGYCDSAASASILFEEPPHSSAQSPTATEVPQYRPGHDTIEHAEFTFGPDGHCHDNDPTARWTGRKYPSKFAFQPVLCPGPITNPRGPNADKGNPKVELQHLEQLGFRLRRSTP